MVTLGALGIIVLVFGILLLHEARLRWRYQRRVTDRLRRLKSRRGAREES